MAGHGHVDRYELLDRARLTPHTGDRVKAAKGAEVSSVRTHADGVILPRAAPAAEGETWRA
jgi:hypothetical protein